MSGDQESVPIYQIKIGARLKEDWTTWFDGMSISHEPDGAGLPMTTLTGPVRDQAALCGILVKICNLNLKLISVVRLELEAESDE